MVSFEYDIGPQNGSISKSFHQALMGDERIYPEHRAVFSKGAALQRTIALL